MENMENNKQVLQIPIEDIIPNRFQPRLAFDDKALGDLANSIKQHGIIQPLVLRRIDDKYEIVAGERRYKAAKLAGLVAVPAIITEMDDNTSAEVAIVENVQRKDLTAIEEARSYNTLLEKENLTQEELANKMGLSQAAISNKLRLLSLDDEVQKAVLEEKISERHARTLLKLKDHNDQKAMLKKIIEERLTVRQLDKEIEKFLINEQNNNNEPKIDKTVVEGPKEEEENMFNNPETVTNRFFKNLESETANISISANKDDTFDTNTEPKIESLLNQTENIEMLGDFDMPTTNATSNEPKKDKEEYFNKVLTDINDLNLDKNIVKIEKINLPTEYVINIKIDKD